jgi:PPOX class probable F420-dependent enzyme
MRPFVRAVAAAAGIWTTAVGVRDVDAFQLGIGVSLLLAVCWADALSVVLAGFLVGTTVHAYDHESYPLAAVSVLVAAALVARLKTLGWVVGDPGGAASADLAPFRRQKTVLLTTYRRDGTPVGAPVSIAVAGDHAYLRSFEKAWKTRRLARNPDAIVTPATMRGRPTGPGRPATVHRIDGAEARLAATALARKYPVLHGALVPLAHRLGRARTGRTVHFVLTPAATLASSSSSATARQSP